MKYRCSRCKADVEIPDHEVPVVCKTLNCQSYMFSLVKDEEKIPEPEPENPV